MTGPGNRLLEVRDLKVRFRTKNGTVHAGNSSGITDGAAAMMILSEKKAASLGIEPMARIAGYASAGVDPAVMGIGPVPAIRKLLDRTNVRLEDVDLVELNEAFAVQVLACQRELGIPLERLNVNGGAIALAIVAPQVAAFGYLAIAVVGVLRARGDETAPPEPA